MGVKAAAASIRIFLRTSSKLIFRSNLFAARGISSKGFTLLEIMLALTLVAGIAFLLLPRLTRTKTNFNKSLKDLSVLSKEIRNSSRLKQSTYRLSFEVGPNEKKYWLEVAPGRAPIEKGSGSIINQEKEKKSPFQQTSYPLKGLRELPGKLYFQQLETLHGGLVTNGTAHIHFSPDGLVEQAALVITDGDKLTWTLIFNPLTGNVDVADQILSLKDLETN